MVYDIYRAFGLARYNQSARYPSSS